MPTPIKKVEMQKTSKKAVKSLPDGDLRQQIEKRAYDIWLAKGRGHGGDVGHWLQAESEVRAEHQNITCS